MIKNGRQLAPTLAGIRDDHVARYRLAAAEATAAGLTEALDVGCGAGYGSYVLALAGLQVSGYDIDAGAIAYGDQHYGHPAITRAVADLAGVAVPSGCLVAAFEIIEHSEGAPSFLARAASSAALLVGSVPNEAAIPFSRNKHPEHYRHYTADELVRELAGAGWRATMLGSQKGKHGIDAVVHDGLTGGRTLVFVAEPAR